MFLNCNNYRGISFPIIIIIIIIIKYVGSLTAGPIKNYYVFKLQQLSGHIISQKKNNNINNNNAYNNDNNNNNNNRIYA